MATKVSCFLVGIIAGGISTSIFLAAGGMSTPEGRLMLTLLVVEGLALAIAAPKVALDIWRSIQRMYRLYRHWRLPA